VLLDCSLDRSEQKPFLQVDQFSHFCDKLHYRVTEKNENIKSSLVYLSERGYIRKYTNWHDKNTICTNAC